MGGGRTYDIKSMYTNNGAVKMGKKHISFNRAMQLKPHPLQQKISTNW
jgi:hypothetical protein